MPGAPVFLYGREGNLLFLSHPAPALPRPSIIPQQLDTQLLPCLLWMWPTLGEGCEPGSPSIHFLLPGMKSIALHILGKRYPAFLTPLSDSGHPLGHGLCSLQKEEPVSLSAPHPGSFSNRVPVGYLLVQGWGQVRLRKESPGQNFQPS